MPIHPIEIWIKGLTAAAIAGAANGVITGFAAVGIDPAKFNLQSGLRATLAIAGVSAIMSGIIGVAAYLKQSPLPSE
jgi:integral membrane sensor domain MASE1